MNLLYFSFNIAYNLIGDEGGKNIGQCFFNMNNINFLELNLSHNCITKESCFVIEKSI